MNPHVINLLLDFLLHDYRPEPVLVKSDQLLSNLSRENIQHTNFLKRLRD